MNRELSNNLASPSCPPSPGVDAGCLQPSRAGFAGAARARDSRLSLVLGALVIFALVLAAYHPILPGSFLMDDRRLIEGENPMVTGALGPGTVWFQTDFALSTFALWAQWLAWGANPCGYHAVNMALHGLSAVLLWRLLARLGVPGAWLAGAIFAVHPVGVASVARIAEVKNTLSLPFFLLAALFYVRYEDASFPPKASAPEQPESSSANSERDSSVEPMARKPFPTALWNQSAIRNPQSAILGLRSKIPPPLWYALSLAAFVLALLSKTSAVMLPLLLLAGAAFRRGKIAGRDLVCTGPFFVLALAFGLMSAWFQKYQALAGQVLAPESFWERLAIAGRAFWFYLGKALLPVHLNLVYPRWKVDASSLVSFVPLLLAGAAFLLGWRYRRGIGRPFLWGMGAFALMLFPALGFFDSQFLIRWQVSDHLQYLPLIAPAALAAAALVAALPARIFRAAAAGIVLALTMLTFQRAEAFATPERLYRDTLAKNPDAWAASNDLGVILAARGGTNYEAAIALFTASINSNPDNPDAHANLGQALALQGKFKQAVPEFQAALRLKPLDAPLHRNYADALLGLGGNQPEAVRNLYMALSLKPDLSTRLQLAALLCQEGDLSPAAAQFRQALKADPNCVEALNNLALLLATASDDRLRDGAEAVRLAERARDLPPVNGMCVRGTLAAAYAEAGRFPEAVATAEKAVLEETAAGETPFADLNRYLLTFYRAGKPWHGSIAKPANPYRPGDNPP